MSGSTASRAHRRAARRVAWRERLLDVAATVLGRPRGAEAERWRTGMPILLYHHVHDRGAAVDPFGVSVGVFESHVRWLAERYELLTAGGIHDHLARGETTSSRLAAISFDDGYECTWRVAWPILRRLEVPATLFVDTGRLDTGRPALSSAQLASMAAEGLEIGSHAVSHVAVTGLGQPGLATELRDSRRALEDVVGHPVRGFAPPFGRYDDATVEAARAAGYEYLCTCRQHRTNHPDDSGTFLLDRIEVNRGDDARRLARKIEGRYARVFAAWYRLGADTRHWVNRR